MNPKAFIPLSYGVYILTSWDGDRPTGCTVNCACQITAEPASMMVSVNKENFTHDCIRKTGLFAVSVLAEDSKPIIVGTFGFRSGRNFDKFGKIPYEIRDGMPVIPDACSYLVCKVTGETDTPTHTMFLGEVTGGDVLRDAKPMTYEYYHTVLKGKTQKNAPTYRES